MSFFGVSAPDLLADAAGLASRSSRELRALGRLPADRLAPDSMAPDCNAEVTIEPADQRSGRA